MNQVTKNDDEGARRSNYHKYLFIQLYIKHTSIQLLTYFHPGPIQSINIGLGTLYMLRLRQVLVALFQCVVSKQAMVGIGALFKNSKHEPINHTVKCIKNVHETVHSKYTRVRSPVVVFFRSFFDYIVCTVT